ncbi:MAG TPA: chemotaxis protein CheW [Tepidisphaeraceae bacterium]|nr:chemotaxis protein CheW [Tepidisphaeraceae bacterium]
MNQASQQQKPASAAPPAGAVRKCITFSIGGAHYGLDIARVREIVGFMEIAPTPNPAAHVKGAIDLRGQTLPVVDLRSKLGLPAINGEPEQCIIIVDLNHAGVSFQAGILIDQLGEVIAVDQAAIDACLAAGNAAVPGPVLFVEHARQPVKVCLDVNAAIGAAELAAQLAPDPRQSKAA